MARRLARVLVAVAMVGTAVWAFPARAQDADVRLSPELSRDVATLSPATTYEAIVRFHEGPLSVHEPRLAALGLAVTGALRALPIVAVRGPLSSVAALGHDAAVAFVEPNAALEYNGDTAVWATRVGVVQNAVSGGPYRTADGAVLDGAGVGVAVVDSGVDASHPDLVNRVATNYKTMLRQEFGKTNSDTSSGHGTHVSGIVAGDGTASQGTFKGVAPGATLHVFAAGEGVSVFAAVASLEKIYTGFDSFTPRIRVINNSWGNGAGSPYRPQGSVETVVKKLVQEKGALVVFAAGNDGGNGSLDETNGYCKDPTPGVICVANYDDDETGNRDHELDPSSSRASRANASLFPDISAPGSFITSTFRPTSGALYGSYVVPDLAWQPNYGNGGGTSMAAPHVAGIAALLLQAKPTLTPAEVEDILLDTAHKFSAGGAYEPDPQNSGQTTSFDKGAGLADAVAALRDSRIGLTGSGGPVPPSNAALAAGDGGDASYGAADIVSATVTATTAGLEYSVAVRDAEHRPPTSVGLRILSNVDGKARRTTVNLRPDGTVAPVGAESPDDASTAEASTVSRSGNTVTFFVSYAELGNPASAAAVHNLQVASYITAVYDVAPSPGGTPTGADIILRPLYAPPFSVGV